MIYLITGSPLSGKTEFALNLIKKAHLKRDVLTNMTPHHEIGINTLPLSCINGTYLKTTDPIIIIDEAQHWLSTPGNISIIKEIIEISGKYDLILICQSEQQITKYIKIIPAKVIRLKILNPVKRFIFKIKRHLIIDGILK